MICLYTGLVNNMKYIKILFLLLASAFVFTSCATKPQKAENKQDIQIESKQTPNEDTFTYTPSINHSFLTEKNVGDNITIKGQLLQNGNSFRLIENAASKSRVTFILKMEDTSLIEQLKELTEKTILVSGELLDASSTWTKTMKVLKVEQK